MMQHFKFYATSRETSFDFGFKDGKLYSLYIETTYGNGNMRQQHLYRFPSGSQQAIQTYALKAAIDTVCSDCTSTTTHFDSFFEHLSKDTELFEFAKERIFKEICYMSGKLNSFCKAYNTHTHRT